MHILLDQILTEACHLHLVRVEGESGSWDKRVVEGMQREHGAIHVAAGRVVTNKIVARPEIGGVSVNAVVKGIVAGADGGVGSGVEIVAVIEGVAAGALLHVSEHEGEVDHVASEFGVGMKVCEAAEFGSGGGVRAKGGENLVAQGG